MDYMPILGLSLYRASSLLHVELLVQSGQVHYFIQTSVTRLTTSTEYLENPAFVHPRLPSMSFGNLIVLLTKLNRFIPPAYSFFDIYI